MRQARERDTVLQPHAYLVFPLSHPGLISQHRFLATWWARCSRSTQWTRVDRGPLTEPTAHRYQLGADACVCMVNLVVTAAYVCPNGAEARWFFAGQVLVPLTSLNADMTADVRSSGAAPLVMCKKNLTLWSDTDYISFFVLFDW